MCSVMIVLMVYARLYPDCIIRSPRGLLIQILNITIQIIIIIIIIMIMIIKTMTIIMIICNV